MLSQLEMGLPAPLPKHPELLLLQRTVMEAVVRCRDAVLVSKNECHEAENRDGDADPRKVEREPRCHRCHLLSASRTGSPEESPPPGDTGVLRIRRRRGAVLDRPGRPRQLRGGWPTRAG